MKSVFSKLRGFLVVLLVFIAVSNVSAQLVKVGQKVVINDSYSFKAEFPKKPKVGEGVLKITLWDKDGKQVSDLDVIGSYDMESMAGQHSMAPKTVLTNKQGFYLFPINFSMRGKWDVTLVFKLGDEELYSAVIQVVI
jgi:hypothetical protein